MQCQFSNASVIRYFCTPLSFTYCVSRVLDEYSMRNSATDIMTRYLLNSEKVDFGVQIVK